MKTPLPKGLLFILPFVAVAFFCSNGLFADDAKTRSAYASSFLANYNATFLGTDNTDFPSNEANVVLQTRDGYMWFGSYSGLVRYDGKRYTIWNAVTPNGFGSSNVRALFEDSEGTLWIGTNDRGLVAYRNGIFTVYDKTKGTPSNTIRSITEGADGLIYCGTPDGVFAIGKSGGIGLIPLDTGIHPFLTEIISDSQNDVFMVFNSGEFFAYTGNGKTVQYITDARVWSAAAVSGNRILLGLQDGRIVVTGFDGGNFTVSKFIDTPLLNITSIYEDSKSNIWILSETGIGLLDINEEYHNVGDPNGVGFYTGIYEDYQNGYWITSSKSGVVKLTASAFSDINALYNFDSAAVNALLIDGGNLYIGTDNGLFILDESGRPVLTDLSGFIRSRVRGIFHDSAGNIWICTYAVNGVVRYTPSTGAVKSWLLDDGLVSDRARCMAELPNGVIAIGTGSGISFIRGDIVISANEAFGTDAEIILPTITVLSLVCDANGTLFIGTDGNGIYAVNKNGTVRYREEDGLSGGVVLRMLVNEKTSGVWVSASNGLCYIDENGSVIVIEKIPPYTFLDIMQHNDELILFTASSIILANPDNLLEADLPLEHFTIDKNSGLTVSINANAWNLITEDGSLYFCCMNGISKYTFGGTAMHFIPHAGIIKISADDAEFFDFSETINLDRNSERLTFELSYLSFGLLDEGTLYYMLIGQDARGRNLSKNDNLDVSYTNLRGGKYTFRIWTENSSGETGNLIEIAINKELKFFEHPVVWIGIILISAALIVLLIILIVQENARRHIKKQREYRTIISQALSAISNAIDEKDAYTSGHSVRVAAYSVEIARRLGKGKSFIENLYYIGLLHDVGKIGISNRIINKPAKLTDEEYNTMKQHTIKGKNILKDITTINNLKAGAAEHHEHWNGGGYNEGLSGEKISLEARIISAADTYDAMSSTRSYRTKLPKERIMNEFKRCKGSQFDPDIADVVIEMIDEEYFSSIDTAKVIDSINESM